MVQSFNINRVQIIIPTLRIFAETEKSLTKFVQTTPEILSAVTGCVYTESQTMEKTNLVMTDFTSHSFGVIEMVCEESE